MGSSQRTYGSVSGVRADQDEESGWTAYLEDFSCSNNGSFISSSSSPSLVSDAAWNGSDTNNKNNVVNHVRRLNFKNLKKGSNHKRYSCRDDDNDDLEDTASSPVNSPKVSSLKEMEVNYRRLDDVAAGNFLGKRGSWNNLSEVGGDEKNGKEGVESRKIVELRKRGLCLVPMSALMNYIA
ncbi:Vascular-related protein 1 [Sesamum angolense]|uniref:Vascular-related protein 1 n=1 Tax=Sesamum angolense TaxID=2727404 RepID=A0AAE2BI45_9LAMI|nr:Vascular-related protein 1 [Sesamum angolense]